MKMMEGSMIEILFGMVTLPSMVVVVVAIMMANEVYGFDRQSNDLDFRLLSGLLTLKSNLIMKVDVDCRM